MIIAHIGFPTESFQSPMIYNPYFEQAGIDVVVVPMACQAPAYDQFLRSIFSLDNVIGALITMPHKVRTLDLVDEAAPSARVAGACNAVRRMSDGRLEGNLFDGEGFVRGLRRRGCEMVGACVLVVGNGGVGCAIAAALAAAGARQINLYDTREDSTQVLMQRLRTHYPNVEYRAGHHDPSGMDIVVNASPLGMAPGDPLPVDVTRLAASTFVGEVVMREPMTPLLRAAQQRGCRFQMGIDMLFEQVPIYLEYFGLPSATPEQLRAVARL